MSIDGPEAEAIAGKFPLYSLDTIPAGSYQGVEATTTLAVGAQWITCSTIACALGWFEGSPDHGLRRRSVDRRGRNFQQAEPDSQRFVTIFLTHDVPGAEMPLGERLRICLE